MFSSCIYYYEFISKLLIFIILYNIHDVVEKGEGRLECNTKKNILMLKNKKRILSTIIFINAKYNLTNIKAVCMMYHTAFNKKIISTDNIDEKIDYCSNMETNKTCLYDFHLFFIFIFRKFKGCVV